MNPYSLLLDSDRHSFVGATYLQDELTISKSLAVNAGFRYDYYSYLDESKVDPRAALIYRPWSRTALKYIYGQAFRVPNVYEMYYSVPPLLPNPSLKTEKIRSNEVVWEQAVNDRLWLSTSGFYNLMDGFITAEPVNNGLQIFRNLQNVSSSGIEEEIRAQLPGGLEAAASYSFQETKDKVTDRMLSDSPRDLAKAQLSHPFLRRKVFLSLDAQYRSRIQALDGGRVSPFSLFNGTLFGRNLGKHWDLSGSVYNLLNKTYFDPPSVGNLSMPIQQDGRSFRIKLTWHSGER